MTSELRNFHLSYCLICKHRKNSVDNGVICSVTEKVASFDENCEVFQFDRIESERLRKNLRLQIRSRFPDDSTARFILTNDTLFSEKSNIQPKPKLKLNQLYSVGKLIVIYRIMATLWGLVFLYDLYHLSTDNLPINWEHVVIIVILGAFFLASIHIGFRKKYPSLRITQRGLVFNDKITHWSDILVSGLARKQSNGGSHYLLVLGTKSRGLQTLDISEIDFDVDDLIATVKHHANGTTEKSFHSTSV